MSEYSQVRKCNITMLQSIATKQEEKLSVEGDKRSKEYSKLVLETRLCHQPVVRLRFNGSGSKGTPS